MRVAIIADTHVPSRADAIPGWVRDELREADRVVHAGDFDSAAAHEEVDSLADDLTAVRGNMDPNLGLPEVATLDVAGVRFVVTHGTGPLAGYGDRVGAAVAERADPDRPTVGVAGHTHQRMDETVNGYRVLNPGSATGARPASDPSMMVAEVTDAELSVEVRFD